MKIKTPTGRKGRILNVAERAGRMQGRRAERIGGRELVALNESTSKLARSLRHIEELESKGLLPREVGKGHGGRFSKGRYSKFPDEAKSSFIDYKLALIALRQYAYEEKY